ncbi:FAD-dependent oxidoreductase [Roseomonas sp. CCTCC AB2023176]|uniref:FAD-dependent oxidoreductase n=1 Tax=Roseomonas sp. CCTCC AB2023176 TaxID=3342640 RepID=UPI0035DAC0C8
MQHALILGAGIMGLSTAFALDRAGWRVTVVEQDEVPNPRGASVDDHRLIRHAYGTQRLYARMVDDAYRAWDQVFDAVGERPYVRTGVLALAGEDRSWIEASRADYRDAGREGWDLTPAEAAVRHPWLVPDGLSTAFAAPGGGVLLARRIVAALHRYLTARGVTFVRAAARDADPARARLALSDGTALEGDALVLAAGPWAPRLLPALSGRVVASRQIVVYLDPPASLRDAWAQAPMLLDLSVAGGFYAVPPVAGTALKIGDHRFSRSGDPDQPRDASAEERDAILALAAPRLRDFGAYRVLKAGACYYDVEDREEFVVEPLSDRCVVMSGFSGHGFKFGAVLGQGVAAALTNRALMPHLPGWAAGRENPVPGLTEEAAHA